MKKEKYVPNYPDLDEVSDGMTLTGKTSKEHASIEEAAQRAAAENPEWLLARTSKSAQKEDSRPELEALGFEILDEHDDLFYKVKPPEGWDKSTQGFHTTVVDKQGRTHITQFFKGAFYDRDAFLNIQSPSVSFDFEAEFEDPTLAEAYNKFQSGLHDKLGVEPGDFATQFSDHVKRKLFGQVLVGRVESKVDEHFGANEKDYSERTLFERFICHYFGPLYRAVEKGTLAPEEVVPALLKGFEGKPPYPKEGLKSDGLRIGYESIKGMKKKLKEVREYAKFETEISLDFIYGNPSDVGAMQNVIYTLKKEKHKADNYSLPEAIRYAGETDFVSCRYEDGSLTPRGEEIQRNMEERREFLGSVFNFINPILSDKKRTPEERIKHSWNELVTNFPGYSPIIQKLQNWKEEYEEEACNGVAETVYFTQDQKLPSGLEIRFGFSFMGRFLIKDGKGVITKNREEGRNQEFYLRVHTTSDQPLEKQLEDMGVVEELVSCNFGKYLEN